MSKRRELQVCEKGHEQIVHIEPKCPMCLSKSRHNSMRDQYKNERDKAHDTVQERLELRSDNENLDEMLEAHRETIDELGRFSSHLQNGMDIALAHLNKIETDDEDIMKRVTEAKTIMFTGVECKEAPDPDAVHCDTCWIPMEETEVKDYYRCPKCKREYRVVEEKTEEESIEEEVVGAIVENGDVTGVIIESDEGLDSEFVVDEEEKSLDTEPDAPTQEEEAQETAEAVNTATEDEDEDEEPEDEDPLSELMEDDDEEFEEDPEEDEEVDPVEEESEEEDLEEEGESEAEEVKQSDVPEEAPEDEPDKEATGGDDAESPREDGEGTPDAQE